MPGGKRDELKYGLLDSGAKTVIVDRRRLEYLAPLKAELVLTLIIARDEGEGADYRYEDLLAKTEDDTPPVADIQPDDDFLYCLYVGLYGPPQRRCFNPSRLRFCDLFLGLYRHGAERKRAAGVSLFGDNPGILLAVPLFHVTGSHSIFMLSYLVGRRVSIIYRWDPAEAGQDHQSGKTHEFCRRAKSVI